jgi:hypothetical protein
VHLLSGFLCFDLLCESKYRNQMVLVKKGTGKAYVGLDLQSAVHIQRFATVCKALKSSTLPIDNKQNLTEAFLATISAQLFQHYQVAALAMPRSSAVVW